MNSPPASTERIGPPMKRKLHAEKHAAPDAIRVGIIALRISRPPSLPIMALPPGELSQISSTGEYLVSASPSRIAAPSSITPSARRIRLPLLSSSVKRISGKADQPGDWGQVGLTGSIAAAAGAPESSAATAARRPRLGRQRIATFTGFAAHPLQRRGFLAIDNDDIGDSNAAGAI